MPVTVALKQSAFVTLDGSGNGTASLGPLTAREVWRPTKVAVSANVSPTNEALCKIFAGDQPIAMHYVDGTFSGSSGDSTDSIDGRVLKCGDKVYAVWTGGDAGVIATVVVMGEKDI